jgi:pimeloyl-ACP methyl ester carboxylesterase
LGEAVTSAHDAVIVVPGIMGSELIESATGRVVWGLRDPRWYMRAWTTGKSLETLKLSEEEQAGHYGRIAPTLLLRFPAFVPLLRGFEPYTALVRALREAAVHPEAVAEFAYDWRLPVVHNAAQLAEKAIKHLETWRRHPALTAFRRTRADLDEAKLVIVAHSMGGLLAWHLSRISGVPDEVRATLTLGTPFYGAPKAALLLNTGRGIAMPTGRARDLAVTLPGVYDLLPVYRCLDTGADARCLTPDDIATLGGNRELARQSVRWHANIEAVAPAGHVQVAGAHQPTVQALTLTDGVATGLPYTCAPSANGGIKRDDRGGDGTVPRLSAQLPHASAMPLAQSHGALAKTGEATLIAVDTLLDQRTGPWLGAGDLGLDVPDIVTAGSTLTVRVTGVEHPRYARCQLIDLTSGRPIAAPRLQSQDGHLVATTMAPGPGLYRVRVAGGGTSPVSELVMVRAPDE